MVIVLVILAFTAAFFLVVPRVVDRRRNGVWTVSPVAISKEGADVHRRLFIADLHSDFLLWRRDFFVRYRRGHIDYPRLVESNTALQVFSVVTRSPMGQNYERTENRRDGIGLLVVAQGWPVRTWTSLLARATYQADRLHRFARQSEGQLEIIKTSGDLDRFVARRKDNGGAIAGLLSLEGFHALEGRVENVQVLYDAGFRMMAPVHMFDNDAAGSAHGVLKYGLTEFGRQVVRRLEEMNVIIDLAHASEKTFYDVLEITTRPLVVSHTGIQATYNSTRNLSDEQVRRIAERGGIIGIGFWDGATGGTTVSDIIRAIAHVVNIAGIEHVAYGSDFDGAVRTVFDVTGLPWLTNELLSAGFTESEVMKIAGENVLRFLSSVLPEE